MAVNMKREIDFCLVLATSAGNFIEMGEETI